MVSIITPFYNAQKFLDTAIESVLNQNEQNWELLLINDGSTDDSKRIALSFDDPRIRYLQQENKGVSAARNIGLAQMKGEYFCFLDADDAFPSHSISTRLKLFEQHPGLSFVDGQVRVMDRNLEKESRIWKPNFYGNPLNDLVHQTSKSFFGQTWLFKRDYNRKYLFDENLTHGEDLMFMLETSRDGGIYDYINEPVLLYRDSPGSAMKNLEGLEKGYRKIDRKIGKWPEIKFFSHIMFKLKYRKAMCLAYLEKGHLYKALRAIY